MSTKKANQVVVARLPASLLKQVDKAARQNFRTRSAEVRARLQESFAAPEPKARATA